MGVKILNIKTALTVAEFKLYLLELAVTPVGENEKTPCASELFDFVDSYR